MTAHLAVPFDIAGVDFRDPSNKQAFFSIKERNIDLMPFEKREFLPKDDPNTSCDTNLFFGFFLDGTRNNYGESIRVKDHAHSNVARLYSCFPGRSVPGVIPGEPKWEHQPDQFNHFFRVYTPGVGTAFDLVGDSGKGMDETLGGAAAYKGEPRIIWTLLQAINNLHRFFLKDAPLITPEEAKVLYRRITLTRATLERMTDMPPAQYDEFNPRAHFVARIEFEALLSRLHKAIKLNMTGADGSKACNTDPGVVKEIYVSAFGFSRGAAAARAFANWLVALCRLDAELLGKPGHTLGGFPVKFDFLGLFDTVASVGLANTLNTATGHWQWADAEVSLRVPREFAQCLHLVSGHEVRRSFPLDSISHNGALGTGRTEVVYPGVHSDVGGGYCPKEHGKGKDATGKDMLSRLPLAHMYRAARLAGVPLKLELVSQQSVKDDFRIAPETLAAFNRYVAQARETKGSLTGIMREQCKFHMLWRFMRRQSGPSPLEQTDSYVAAPQVDKNDLQSANDEFTTEVERFYRWRDDYLNPATKEDGSIEARPARPEDIPTSAPGFGNRWEEEWKEIIGFLGIETLPEGMETFFDNYVHDSRAAFMITGTPSYKVEDMLQALLLRMDEYDANRHYDSRPDPLTPQERQWAMTYRKTGKVPPMKNDGREPAVAGAGYLRYRKVYAGGSSILISHGEQRQPANWTAARKAGKLVAV